MNLQTIYNKVRRRNARVDATYIKFEYPALKEEIILTIILESACISTVLLDTRARIA